MASFTLAEIAARVGGRVRGDAGRRVSGIRPLDQAGPDDLSFMAHPRYARAAAASRAAALLVRPGAGAIAGPIPVEVENPYAALAEVIGLFHPAERLRPGVSPLAAVGEGAALGEGLHVAPFAVIGRGAVIGDGAAILAGAVVGDEARVGPGSVLHPGVVVYARCALGARVVVHANSVIGSDGFGYAEAGEERRKIPQVGIVVVEDDVEIGACVTIDRATFGQTVIGRGTKIDNLVQVAHNVVIGPGSILVAQSGIAGSTRLGRGVVMAGQSGAAGHLSLGDRAVVGAKSAVLQDLEPGAFVVGHPAVDHRAWKRSWAALARLPDLLRRVARLERAGEGAARPARRGHAKGAGVRSGAGRRS